MSIKVRFLPSAAAARTNQDSAAVMTHLESFDANFAARFMEMVKPTRFVVYGTPSLQAKDALAGVNPVYMAPFGSFTR